MTHHPAAFLPAAFHENLDAATLLTDEIVLQSLRLAADHALQNSFTGNLTVDACFDAAALIYTRAVNTLRVIKDAGHGPNYGHDTDRVMARVAIGDDLTARAGDPFDLASRLGHLSSPLGDSAFRQGLHSVGVPHATKNPD